MNGSPSSGSVSVIQPERWAHDPEFLQVLSTLLSTPDAVFKRLPHMVLPENVKTRADLAEALEKLFGSQQAEDTGPCVFIWYVENLFCHGGKPTSISNIEETGSRTGAGNVKSRCHRKIGAYAKNRNESAPPSNLVDLARGELIPEGDGKRTDDWNFTYYQTLISKHGPLRIAYATCDDLNGASRQMKSQVPEDWEKAIRAKYEKVYGDWPPKNMKA